MTFIPSSRMATGISRPVRGREWGFEERYLIPVRADGGRWCVSMGAMGLPG